MNDIIWSSYKITNIINNKVYIGQTKSPKTRWSRHKSDARLGKKYNSHIYNAMRKYGIDNFTFEIIAQTKYIENIDVLEILLIEQYQSTNKDIGYNNSPGGQSNKLVSMETRQKMSNEKNPMFGKRSKHAKLTLEQANSIRTEYATGLISMLKLARKFNVSKRTVFNIIHGTIYRC